MEIARKLHSQLKKLSLIKETIIAYPVPEQVAQAELLGLIVEEELAIKSARRTENLHMAVLPTIKHIQAQYAIINQRIMDAQAARLAEQERALSIDGESDMPEQDEEMTELDPRDGKAEDVMSGKEPSSLFSKEDIRLVPEMKERLGRGYVEFACNFFLEQYEEFRDKADPLYQQMIKLIIIDDWRGELKKEAVPSFVEALSYFACPTAVACVFVTPVTLTLWQSIFCPSNGWYTVTTLCVVDAASEVQGKQQANGFSTAYQLIMIISREKRISQIPSIGQIEAHFGTSSFPVSWNLIMGYKVL